MSESLKRWIVATRRGARPDEFGNVPVVWAASIGSPQLPREPISEDYAFLLANVRDAVAEDDE